MSEKICNLRHKISEWCDEYNIDNHRVEFYGYNELGNNVMGICQYRNSNCFIWIDEVFRDKKIGWIETSILWHEFCHAEAYLEDGKINGHDYVFKSKLRRKLFYYIGDIVSKFVFVFMW